MKKIKNVIFDFGQVMVKFDPTYMTQKYVEPGPDRELLKTVLFDRLYWDRLDEGSISDEDVILACKKRLPERLHFACEQAYYNWIYNIPEIEGMSDLVKKIREKYDVRIFLLSNISEYFAKNSHTVACISLFDGHIFSALHGVTKPSYKIFEILCSSYGILPSQSVFIDDSEKNVKGAENFGMTGYLFDSDVGKLEFFLDTILSS